MIILNAGLFKVLNLNKVRCKRHLIINKVWNCRNTWLQLENTPAKVNNWISVLPASHHLLTTGTSKKPSPQGRDHPEWPLPRHSVLVQPLPAMNRTHMHPPLSVPLHRHGLQSAPRQQPQRPCSAAGGKPAQEGGAETPEELQPRTWRREGSPPESGLSYPLADYPVCCLTVHQVQKQLSCFHQI